MAATCPSKTENLKFCTCTYDCDKRGNCCACVMYHRGKGQIPGCFFSKEGEATWNRSVQNLCKDQGIC